MWGRPEGKKGHRKKIQFCIGSGADWVAGAGACCWGVGGAGADGADDGADVGTAGAGVEGARKFFNFFLLLLTISHRIFFNSECKH